MGCKFWNYFQVQELLLSKLSRFHLFLEMDQVKEVECWSPEHNKNADKIENIF
jgi:hypothetical protein